MRATRSKVRVRFDRRLFFWLAVSASFPLLFCAGAERPSASLSRPEVVQFAPDYFLLPPPHNADEADAAARSLRLWSAPTLSLELILTEAERNEGRSRAALLERTRAEQARLCALAPGDRELRLLALEAELIRQHQLWRATFERYENQLAREADYAATGPRDRADSDDASDANLTRRTRRERLQTARKAVQALARERSELMERYWRDFARGLGAQNADPAACAAAPAPAPPREKLYAPYYLALYRFFEELPPAERARLLLKLHPE